jgi:hypothetical protein
MDDELPIPLEGRPVRVFANLIQQAHDLLQTRGGDYVTFVVVGSSAVSLYTGRPQRRMIEPPTIEGRAGRVAKSRDHTIKSRKPRVVGHPPRSAIDVNALQILELFSSKPSRELTTLEIGDQLKLPRKDALKRQSLSRLIAELRVSGLIRPTANVRIPSYQFVSDIPDLDVDEKPSQHSVLALMQQVDRPLAFGIIGDLFRIARTNREQRHALSSILTELTKLNQLRMSNDERMKIAVYRVA